MYLSPHFPEILLKRGTNWFGSRCETPLFQAATDSKQRDHLRSLWYSDVDDLNSGVFRFSIVAFDLTSTCTLLKATIEHHIVLASMFK